MVNESDWVLYDLERLIVGGITDTQASVIRKTAEAFTVALVRKLLLLRLFSRKARRW